MKLFDVMTHDSCEDVDILHLIITASSVNKIKYAFANGNCWNEILKKKSYPFLYVTWVILCHTQQKTIHSQPIIKLRSIKSNECSLG